MKKRRYDIIGGAPTRPGGARAETRRGAPVGSGVSGEWCLGVTMGARKIAKKERTRERERVGPHEFARRRQRHAPTEGRHARESFAHGALANGRWSRVGGDGGSMRGAAGGTRRAGLGSQAVEDLRLAAAPEGRRDAHPRLRRRTAAQTCRRVPDPRIFVRSQSQPSPWGRLKARAKIEAQSLGFTTARWFHLSAGTLLMKMRGR